jgi:DNA-binding NtrC family response regulator
MMQGRRIVLVEDDAIMGGSIAQRLELEGAEVVWLKQMVRALGALRTPRAPVDAVVCDIRLPDGSGEELFVTLCRAGTPPPFLFITGQGEIDQAVRLLQAGAAHYVTKPFDMGSFLESLAFRMASRPGRDVRPLIGVSQTACRVAELAEKAAEHDHPVLICGEQGSGKGLIARRIHQLSDRRAAPFISFDAVHEPNLETAIFSGSGAIGRVGDGVLYLSALDRLPLPLQRRLHEIVEGRFQGRLIVGCDGAVDRKVAAGTILSDLYYRLGRSEIAVPPLRDRTEDAVWLLNDLFAAYNGRRETPLTGVGGLSEEAVRAHDWPGGGRELRSRLIRALDSARGPLLQPTDLFPERVARGDDFLSLAEARQAAERAQIIAALDRADGQVGEAAKLLRIARTTLWEKMTRLDLS